MQTLSIRSPVVVAAASEEEPVEVEAEAVEEVAPEPEVGQEAVAILRNIRGSPNKVRHRDECHLGAVSSP